MIDVAGVASYGRPAGGDLFKKLTTPILIAAVGGMAAPQRVHPRGFRPELLSAACGGNPGRLKLLSAAPSEVKRPSRSGRRAC